MHLIRMNMANIKAKILEMIEIYGNIVKMRYNIK